MAKIQRALISVFDKTGLIPFAQTLAASKVELVSTGGTAKALREVGLSEVEILDLILSASIFGWANRLMHTLGEPVAD